MSIAQLIRRFFRAVEEAWAEIPSYVKVFLYATTSSTLGLWMAGQLNWQAVVIIVATNLGIYQVPRTIAKSL